MMMSHRVHTQRTTDRTANLLISFNVHYVHLSGDKNWKWNMLIVLCMQGVLLASRTLRQWMAATKWWNVPWPGPALDANANHSIAELIYSSSMMHRNSWLSLPVSFCFSFCSLSRLHQTDQSWENRNFGFFLLSKLFRVSKTFYMEIK